MTVRTLNPACFNSSTKTPDWEGASSQILTNEGYDVTGNMLKLLVDWDLVCGYTLSIPLGLGRDV